MEESTTMNAQTSDDFLDGWDDAPETTEEPQSETAETGESAEETPSESQTESAPEIQDAPETQETAVPPASAPKQWVLRHLDQERTVGETEMTALAQKGLDYDRIRAKYDESKGVMELFAQFAKQAGMSVNDYVAHIRTQAKLTTGMSEAEARREVALEDREAAVAEAEAVERSRQDAQARSRTQAAAVQERRGTDIADFAKYFPAEAKDPKLIPPAVWNDVQGGMSLVTAMYKHQAEAEKTARETAERANAAADQTRRNAHRSAGSMASAGENTAGKDPFLEGWNS